MCPELRPKFATCTRRKTSTKKPSEGFQVCARLDLVHRLDNGYKKRGVFLACFQRWTEYNQYECDFLS